MASRDPSSPGAVASLPDHRVRALLACGPRRLSPATPPDAPTLSAMSWDIWHRHYCPEILSLPEVRHLWGRAYRPESIAAEIERGAVYHWIEYADARTGFVAWRTAAEQSRLWLGKLYVLPELHGIGLGAFALECAECAARSQALSEISLYVFKRNASAIRAYQRAGFRIVAAEVSDAGSGFVYDDYVMSKRLAPVSLSDAAPSPRPA